MRLGFTTFVLAVLSVGTASLQAQIVNDTVDGHGARHQLGNRRKLDNRRPARSARRRTNVFFTLSTGAFTSTVDTAYTVANLDIGGGLPRARSR